MVLSQGHLKRKLEAKKQYMNAKRDRVTLTTSQSSNSTEHSFSNSQSDEIIVPSEVVPLNSSLPIAGSSRTSEGENRNNTSTDTVLNERDLTSTALEIRRTDNEVPSSTSFELKELTIRVERSSLISEMIISNTANTNDRDSATTIPHSSTIREGDEESSSRTFELRNLTVQIERNPLISDMVIFAEIKRTVMESNGRRRASSNEIQLSDNNEDASTPMVSTPSLWPLTPTSNTLVDQTPPTTSTTTAIEHVSDTPTVQPAEIPRPIRRHAVVPHRVTYRNGITISPEELENACTQPQNCGTMTHLCRFCDALFFTGEKTDRRGQYTSCCNKGAYTLPPYSPCPAIIKELYVGSGLMASEFRKNIRYLNSLFAMASFKTSAPIPLKILPHSLKNRSRNILLSHNVVSA